MNAPPTTPSPPAHRHGRNARAQRHAEHAPGKWVCAEEWGVRACRAEPQSRTAAAPPHGCRHELFGAGGAESARALWQRRGAERCTLRTRAHVAGRAGRVAAAGPALVTAAARLALDTAACKSTGGRVGGWVSAGVGAGAGAGVGADGDAGGALLSEPRGSNGRAKAGWHGTNQGRCAGGLVGPRRYSIKAGQAGPTPKGTAGRIRSGASRPQRQRDPGAACS